LFGVGLDVCDIDISDLYSKTTTKHEKNVDFKKKKKQMQSKRCALALLRKAKSNKFSCFLFFVLFFVLFFDFEIILARNYC
jgi:hypothetical protein